MKGVIAFAFRRTLGRVVFFFGLFALLWTVLARERVARLASWYGTTGLNPARLSLYPHSPWDFPIAGGATAVGVLAGLLIFRARRPAAISAR